MTTPKKATKTLKTNPNIIKNATVRFDATKGQWGIVENTDTMEAVRHFDYGVMKNITFTSYPVTEERRHGCGGSIYKKTYVGVAVGELHIGEEAKSMKSAKNLKFGNNGFLDYKEQVILKAKQLAMTPDRRALYWE